MGSEGGYIKRGDFKSIKFKPNNNFDKLKNDPIAFAEEFPCPNCETTSKRIAEKKFNCKSCDLDFEIVPNYVDRSGNTK